MIECDVGRRTLYADLGNGEAFGAAEVTPFDGYSPRGLHMRLTGHPARAAGLERLLDYVTKQDGVWIT